jgi:hypothetical protein
MRSLHKEHKVKARLLVSMFHLQIIKRASIKNKKWHWVCIKNFKTI